ncbi:MAG TPA: DEAD/DEAH box helicase [Anaerolineae bacterium]|nr:DEAD/DEAH box helicase [Anaerolineae bacterium]
MKITLTNNLTISGAPEALLRKIRGILTIENPVFLDNKKMGRWNGNTPAHLKFYEKTDNGGLVIPRGFTKQLITMAHELDLPYQLEDNRRTLPVIDFTFHGKLRPFQEKAVTGILSRDFGTLSAATGSGKTVIALYMIAKRKQPALIVVHTKELLNQWIDRIETFLKIPKDEIGIIGNGKHTIGAKITVALVQSLYKCAEEVSQHIGHLIIDECHRAPSRTFTEAVTAFDSKYMLGLSATPWRRDGLSKLIYWHIGDVSHEVDKTGLIENGDILQADIVIRETNFTTCLDPSNEYSKMLSELTQDTERNHLITSGVAKEAKNGGGICLVLSDRKAHCKALQQVLTDDYNVSSVLLTGDIPAKQRQDIVNRLNKGRIKVLIATGQLIGEGFDLPEMQTLFLTTPISFDGRVLQYLGRVLRPSPGKKNAKVYDYADVNVGVLKAAANSRQMVYKKQR